MEASYYYDDSRRPLEIHHRSFLPSAPNSTDHYPPLAPRGHAGEISSNTGHGWARRPTTTAQKSTTSPLRQNRYWTSNPGQHQYNEAYPHPHAPLYAYPGYASRRDIEACPVFLQYAVPREAHVQRPSLHPHPHQYPRSTADTAASAAEQRRDEAETDESEGEGSDPPKRKRRWSRIGEVVFKVAVGIGSLGGVGVTLWQVAGG
ncbi:hypothetical protein MBLNU459_g6759t1 [Dothideomycetes sp. NU459]